MSLVSTPFWHVGATGGLTGASVDRTVISRAQSEGAGAPRLPHHHVGSGTCRHGDAAWPVPMLCLSGVRSVGQVILRTASHGGGPAHEQERRRSARRAR